VHALRRKSLRMTYRRRQHGGTGLRECLARREWTELRVSPSKPGLGPAMTMKLAYCGQWCPQGERENGRLAVPAAQDAGPAARKRLQVWALNTASGACRSTAGVSVPSSRNSPTLRYGLELGPDRARCITAVCVPSGACDAGSMRAELNVRCEQISYGEAGKRAKVVPLPTGHWADSTPRRAQQSSYL